MYDTPVSLQDYCVDFICENLSALCKVQPAPTADSKQLKMFFKDPDSCFHANLSDKLLSTLSEKGKLSDETLSLFDPKVTALRHISIHSAPVTSRGLRILKGHRISRLEVTGIKDVTVNDIIGCLGEWTLSNLRILNVSKNTFLNNSKFCVVSLSEFRNLHTLNVSFTEFNRHGLEIIAENLPCLEVLDISCTEINDISSLRKRKNSLKSLSMFNLQLHTDYDPIDVVSELVHLVHLDVSNDATRESIITSVAKESFQVAEYLSRSDINPCLVSLDVSGCSDVAPCVVESFLERHPKLHFLGLALTSISEYEMFQPDSCWNRLHPDFKVAGESTKAQIMESLHRYRPRGAYMQKAMFNLFKLLRGTEGPQEDIIKLVLPVMKSHPKILPMQISATACLCYSTRGDGGGKIHPVLLSRSVDLTLTAMENFPNDKQLLKNALLTLCNDRILRKVNFDRFRCLRLVTECMCQFDDASMNTSFVVICSRLASKISIEETTILGARARYVKKLLVLIEERLMNHELDITLTFALSALWILTDEAPSTCNVFLTEGGLELCMKLLQLTDGEETDECVQVENNILGLLNNIAEMKASRYKLMRADFIMLIKQMLHRQHIEVSYFAAGILAHLCSDGEDAWRHIAGLDRCEILEDLSSVVARWDQPKETLAVYRSFRIFFTLLRNHDTALQLWAVWAIYHVCSKKGKRHLPVLDREGGYEHIHHLMTTSGLDSKVKSICQEILVKLEEHKGGPPKYCNGKNF